MAVETLWWRDQDGERTWRVQGSSPGPAWTLAPPAQRVTVHGHDHWLLPGVGCFAVDSPWELKRVITKRKA